MYIVLAILGLVGSLQGEEAVVHTPQSWGDWAPKKTKSYYMPVLCLILKHKYTLSSWDLGGKMIQI